MRRNAFTLATMVAIMMIFSGCFSVYTGGAPGNTDRTKVKGYGLGPDARTEIWTESKDAAIRKAFVIQSDTYTELAERVNPAVVNIFTTQKVEAGFGMGLFSVPVPNMDLNVQSLGTGFIISADGFMLTNYHVIRYADEISVFLHETNEVQSIEVVGADPLTDLALLKISGRNDLPYLPLADSDAAMVGEPVIAVGNPFGLAHSLTTGVVSAKNRTLSPGTRRGNYEQYIQTSAQINPGNSGGPLLNLYGEVVGINTAIIAKAQGIGFAIPSNMIKELLPELVRKGHVERGYLGIAVVDLTPMVAKRFKVNQNEGVMIGSLDPEGPAADAGLQRGDIIVAVDGVEVENAHDTGRRISLLAAGKKVPVLVSRDGKNQTFTVTVEEL
jgi:serine protease Do